MAAYKIWITVFAFFALCADPLAAATSTKLPPFVLKMLGLNGEIKTPDELSMS